MFAAAFRYIFYCVSSRLAESHRTNLPLRAAEHVIVDPPTNGTRALEFRRAKKG